MSKPLELFYFEGCPSWERALENLEEAMSLAGLTGPVVTVLVTSAEDAQRRQFLGSPTIRIDGVDVEGVESQGRTVGFMCRIYEEGAQAAGWPSVALIRQALQKG